MAQVMETSCTEALHCVTTLAQSGDVDEAAELLRNECAQAPAGSVAAARHAVLEGYIRQERVEAAAAFALEALRMPGRHQELQQHSQDLVLRSLLQAQHHSRAVELLSAMCDPVDAAPSDQVFNTVLDSSVRARAYGEAWDVLELLLNCSRKADKYFVSILTKSLESSADKRWLKRGIALVERFIDQQREDVDEIVFNSLLNVLGHMGDMQRLQQTLDKMTEYNVAASAVTFGTVVKAYGRARDIDAVIRVWNQMRSRCLGVNPVTCGCVLDACVKCGNLDKAMSIFQEMRMQGMHKNTVLYATLIKGVGKVRDLQRAMQLYQEMRMEGVPCNLVTFNSLMDVCVNCGDLGTAAYFLQDMMSMGIEPDLITFSTLIKGYSHTGEVHKALALSKELKSRGLKCDEIMYNSLIDGCAKAHKVEEGMMVFREMLQMRVQPSNITFSILVKLYFEAGQVEEAFSLVEDMYPKYRCTPSRIVYSVLLRCCAHHGGFTLARGAQLLVELASKKNSKMPDQVMVSSMLSASVQHGDFETAARLVRDFTAFGARRNTGTIGPDSLKMLFEALGAQHEQMGRELLEYLRRKSMPPAQCSALEAALAQGKEQGWSAARAEELVAGGSGVYPADASDAHSPGAAAPLPPSQPLYHAAHVPATLPGTQMPGMQLPPPSMPPALDPFAQWQDPAMSSYAPNAFYPQYNPAAAAAAAAAAAHAYNQSYNQTMAGYAAAAAAAAAAAVAYPQPAPIPSMLQSPEVAAAATSPQAQVAHATMPAMSPAMAPPLHPPAAVPAAPPPMAPVAPVASYQPPASGSYLPPPHAQAPSPLPKAPAAAAALALTPLPAGPLSPSAAAETPPPVARGTDKASLGKENSMRRNKDLDAGGKAKGKRQVQQNRESLQKQQLRDKAAALQAVQPAAAGRLEE
eukprot:TRINITY_DN90657_c0_g1_i1.p1 TRINITY_DN90657_c0_g1~~TRINITY_DN90657_c0_g1_i1.p1  ORF type:complete len:939 (-),score=252.60 TRINITY_DN90657_c0_g1_i1:145-2892(-)